MPGARLLVDEVPEVGATCRISGEEVAHARARRLSAGDPVVLVDGSGREASGCVTRIEPGALDVSIASVRVAPEEAIAPLHLLVAAVRSERLSWIAEKATELGAAQMTLVLSERTQRFRAGGTLSARLSRVVREAAKQAECARWPRIAGPIAFPAVLPGEASESRLILDPGGEDFPPILPPLRAALLVGPEGGWTEAELAAALASGWIAVSLAAGKLRAETAAIAALALARTALLRGLKQQHEHRTSNV